MAVGFSQSDVLKDQSGSFMTSSDLATEVMRHHYCCILLVIRLTQIRRRIYKGLDVGRHGLLGSHLWKLASESLVCIGILLHGILVCIGILLLKGQGLGGGQGRW